jgi:chromosome partitioning protein
MGVVVTVMNMKGGVGKTTVTVNLGGTLSRYGVGGAPALRVLMIDYDPQFNLSQAYLDSKKYFALEKLRKTILAVLLDSGTALDPYKIQVPGNHTPPQVASLAATVHGKNLHLVPSTLDLMYVALGQATTNSKPIEERFEKFIDECRSAYDLVLIDCHPAGSLFTKTSLNNSDFVLIPVAPQKYATRGIALMMDFIKAKKAGTKGPEPIILFNATKRSGVSPEEAAIRGDAKFAPFCLTNSLKWYKAFGEPEEGSGFVWLSNKPWSTSAFVNLFAVAREFRNKIGL